MRKTRKSFGEKFLAVTAAVLMATALASSTAAAAGAGNDTVVPASQGDTVTISNLGLTVTVPEDTFIVTGEDGYVTVYLEDYGQSIPYVIFGAEQLPADKYFQAFTNLLKEHYADLTVVAEPVTVQVGNRKMQKVQYNYTVSGHTVVDTRLYTEVNGITYSFGSKEVPAIDYTVGSMLTDIAGSMRVAGETVPDIEQEPEPTNRTDSGKAGLSELLAGLFGGKTPSENEPPESTENDPQNPVSTEQGKNGQEEPQSGLIMLPPMQYTKSPVLSAATKTEMARCFAPTGWTVDNAVRAVGMGIATPVQAVIQAASPDKEAVFTYYSARSFVDHLSTYNDQVFKANDGDYDGEHMALCYEYRPAIDYCDMLAAESLQEGIQIQPILEIGPTPEQKKILLTMGQKLREEYREIGKLTGNNSELDEAECSFAIKFYSLKLKDAFTKAGSKEEDQRDYILVTTTFVQMTKWSSTTVYGGGGKKVTGPFGIEMVDGFTSTIVNTDWFPLAGYVALIPRDRFEELYPAFEMFENNTRVSDEFFLMRSELSSQIQYTNQLIRDGYNVELDLERMYREACQKHLQHALYVTGSEMLYDFFPDYTYFMTASDEPFRVYDGYGNAYEDGKGSILCTGEESAPVGMTPCKRIVSDGNEPTEGPQEAETEEVATIEATEAETTSAGNGLKFPFR